MSLEGKVAIITGAARGIGRATALKLADEGADIVIGDISEKAKETVEEVKKKGREALYIKVDVSKKSDLQQMVDKTVELFGHIDILVNNAGIAQIVKFEDLSEEDWDRMLDINLKGTFLCSQLVFKQMKKQGSGRIINLTSLAAKVGGILVGANYAASKAGVTALTKSIAKTAAQYGINVNAVSPGFIATDMTKEFDYDLSTVPLGRLGTAEDVADVIHFLTSDASRYLTGEIIDVDGGINMD